MQHSLVFSALVFFAMCAGGCAGSTAALPSSPAQARTSAVACVDAPPGSRCTMAMGDGDSSMALTCTKQIDGAVACDGQ